MLFDPDLEVEIVVRACKGKGIIRYYDLYAVVQYFLYKFNDKINVETGY